jgi:hypothetical protein
MVSLKVVLNLAAGLGGRVAILRNEAKSWAQVAFEKTNPTGGLRAALGRIEMNLKKRTQRR